VNPLLNKATLDLKQERSAGKKPHICVVGEMLLEFLPADENVLFQTFGPMYKSPSGAACIFACAAAALGARVQLLGRTGTDPFSRFVHEVISGYGVDTSRLIEDRERQIGLSFVEEQAGARRFVYYRKNSAGSMLSAEDIDPAVVRQAEALYFPAMLLGLSPQMRSACLAALAVAREAGLITALDLNIRQELWPDRDDGLLKKVISQLNLLTLNQNEAFLITGEMDAKAALSRLLSYGPLVVAITRGADGLIIGAEDELVEVSGLPVQVVDTVGAGDICAAGLLTGLLEGMSLEEAGRFANATAALKIGRMGAIGRGIPTRAEVQDFLARHYGKP